jgi:hypothetical protein
LAEPRLRRRRQGAFAPSTPPALGCTPLTWTPRRTSAWQGAFFETTNGGKQWFARSFTNLDAEEEINYRFEKVSFKENEAWVIGKPAILLHSKDAGKNWERVPLSPKLPGAIILVRGVLLLFVAPERCRVWLTPWLGLQASPTA